MLTLLLALLLDCVTSAGTEAFLSVVNFFNKLEYLSTL